MNPRVSREPPDRRLQGRGTNTFIKNRTSEPRKGTGSVKGFAVVFPA